MKIPNSRHRGDGANDQAMTSMIDVVFLLLIFFVCASIGQVGELLVASEMSAGTVDAEQISPPEQLRDVVTIVLRADDAGESIVTVNAGNDVFRRTDERRFERAAEPKSLTEMLRQLAEVDPEQLVVLDIADGVPMGDAMTVYTASQNAGFASINYAMDAE